MNKEKAIRIAKEHLLEFEKKNKIPNVRWIVREAREVKDGWYFDYSFELIDDSKGPVYLTGAPGFIVSKSSAEIQVVSWDSITNKDE
jgi:hypothetical protein